MSRAGGTIEETTGLPEDILTEAEIERVSWAVGEVQRRLYAMGGKS